MIFTIAIVLTWCAAAYRIWVLATQPRTVWRTAISISMLATAIAFTLYRTRLILDEQLGVPNVSGLAARVVFALGIGFLLIYLDALRRETVPRHRIMVYLAVAASVAVIMIASWAAAPIHDRAVEDLQPLASHPAVLVYCVIFWVYLGWALVIMAAVSFALSRRSRSEDSTRSISLVVIGAAAAGAIPTLVLWTASILIRHVTGRPVTRLNEIGDAILPWPLLVDALGALSLFVLPYLAALVTTGRQLEQLTLLWQELIARYPQVHLDFHSSGGPLTRLQTRAERAIIEIHDALRIAEVDPHAPASIEALARGLRRPVTGGRRAADLLDRVDSRDADVAQILDLARAFRATRP